MIIDDKYNIDLQYFASIPRTKMSMRNDAPNRRKPMAIQADSPEKGPSFIRAIASRYSEHHQNKTSHNLPFLLDDCHIESNCFFYNCSIRHLFKDHK